MKKVMLALALIVLGCTAVSAQTPTTTTLSTTTLFGNQGAPARVAFVFGNIPGATELVVQCDLFIDGHRGRTELLENFDTSEQAGTNFFPVDCTEKVNGTVYQFDVAATTANVTRVNADGTTTPITISVSGTSWQATRGACGRGSPCWKNFIGASMITITETTTGD
jgi:hypothetical protein